MGFVAGKFGDGKCFLCKKQLCSYLTYDTPQSQVANFVLFSCASEAIFENVKSRCSWPWGYFVSNIFYKNNLLNFSFRIPATTLIAYETDTNSKMGVFVRFEGPDFNPGYITFNSSNGEYFKRSSEVSEGELGHVDWWTDYEEYQKKVITKKTTLDEYERIISLNTRTYLETIFYDLGGENYLLNVVTYHKNKKYSLTYNFPAQWHDNTYSWSVENRKKVIQEIQKQSIPEPYLTNLKKFWTIVRSLSLE